ncbi:MAG: TPM domain-containing protein [Candidatus Eremiobacteraeota bacterium]|nr:TPM domain-containing protein [Candidatus Eremiobacteraeota bacterium]
MFRTDRKVRIEVGYCLEQTELKAGHPDAAVTAGVDQILGAVGGGARGNGGATRATRDGVTGKSDEAPSGGTAPQPVHVDADNGSSRLGDIFWNSVGVLIGLVIAIGSSC